MASPGIALLPDSTVSNLISSNNAVSDSVIGIQDSGISATVTPDSTPYSAQDALTAGTPDATNSGWLSLLNTIIATGATLGAAAIAPQKVQPGPGAQNPAKPTQAAASSIVSGLTNTSLLLILALIALGGVLLFSHFHKGR